MRPCLCVPLPPHGSSCILPAVESVWGHPHGAQDEEQEHCASAGQVSGEGEWGAAGAGGLLPQKAQHLLGEQERHGEIFMVPNTSEALKYNFMS